MASQIAWLEIQPDAGAFYLLYFSAAGACLADTWHASVGDAKDQARAEFEIEETDWKELR